MWLGLILFIHSPVDRHLGCVHVLVVASNASSNVHVQGSACTFVVNSLFRKCTQVGSGGSLLMGLGTLWLMRMSWNSVEAQNGLNVAGLHPLK